MSAPAAEAERPRRAGALEVNLRATWARAYPRIFAVNRDWTWPLFDVVLPIMGVMAFVYIYKAMNAPREYIGFVVMGGAMTTYWMNVLWSMAAQFFWEKNDGNLQLYFLAPIHPAAILAGMAVGGLVNATLRAASMLILGSWIFGVSYLTGGWYWALAVFFLTLVALYGMGACFASLYLFYGREAWHTNNLLQEPIYLLSGFYFPVRALGAVWAIIGSVVPLTMGMDAVRQLVFGTHLGFIPVRYEVAILAGLTVLFLWGALWGLRTMERLAKKEGRLTLRWQ